MTLTYGSAVERVYPRVCGGTLYGYHVVRDMLGLSPRMRGNPSLPLKKGCCAGSIPAYAGEPPAHSHDWRSERVYPRVCGGTLVADNIIEDANGLSPRMRGNPGGVGGRKGGCGSIPAYAGEPSVKPKSWNAIWVYPRVCGGTDLLRLTGLLPQGLSPRMRGNRWRYDGVGAK